MTPTPFPADPLVVGTRTFESRLLLGTGKYKDFDETRRAVDESGAQIVTVAIRRTNIGQDKAAPSLLDALPPSRYTLLPNTAWCRGVSWWASPPFTPASAPPCCRSHWHTAGWL